MSSVLVLVGASVITFLLILLFMKLGDNKKDENGKEKNNHVLLQILILGFILAGFVIIGKAGLDGEQNCEWLVNQTTVTGNTTTYTHAYQCQADTTRTADTLYGLTVWIMRGVATYVFCYLVYVVLVYFGYLGNDKKGRDD